MKVAQSCLTLCDPMDCIVHGILQARILEDFPSPGDLPNPGTAPRSPALQADSFPAELQGQMVKPQVNPNLCFSLSAEDINTCNVTSLGRL